MSNAAKCKRRVPLEERDTYHFAIQTLSYMLAEFGIEKENGTTVQLDPVVSDSIEPVAKATFVLVYFSRIGIEDEFKLAHPEFSDDDFILFVLDTINNTFDDDVFGFTLDALSIIFALARFNYDKVKHDMLRLGAECFAELLDHREAAFKAKGEWKGLREYSAIYENAFDEFLRPVVLTDEPIFWDDILLSIDALGRYNKLMDVVNVVKLIFEEEEPLNVERFKTLIPLLKAYAIILRFKEENPLALNSHYLSIIIPKRIFPQPQQTAARDNVCSKD